MDVAFDLTETARKQLESARFKSRLVAKVIPAAATTHEICSLFRISGASAHELFADALLEVGRATVQSLFDRAVVADMVGFYPSEPLLTQDDASVLLEELGKPLTISTLATYRCRGRGPAYLKIGGGVRYRRSDLEDWASCTT